MDVYDSDLPGVRFFSEMMAAVNYFQTLKWSFSIIGVDPGGSIVFPIILLGGDKEENAPPIIEHIINLLISLNLIVFSITSCESEKLV